MGFRTGILIGVLATAVLALSIAVIVLLADDSGDAGPEETRARIAADLPPATRDNGGVACRFEQYGGPVEIELNSSGLTCVEARRVFTEYRVALEDEDQVTGIGRETVVGDGWLCEEFPNADYPLMATCSQGSASFDLVGRAPSAHAPPQPVDEEAQNSRPAIFHSPTGNIACSISVASLRCDILKTRYKPGPRPSGCEPTAVWGHSFLLTEGGVKSICTNDAVMDFTKPESYPTLGYGKEINRGPFCFMEKTGLACGTPNEHYLFLSYQRVTGI